MEADKEGVQFGQETNDNGGEDNAGDENAGIESAVQDRAVQDPAVQDRAANNDNDVVNIEDDGDEGVEEEAGDEVVEGEARRGPRPELRKRKKISPVWDFSEKVEPNKIKCKVMVSGKVCNQVLGSVDGNTSNILSHIRNTHGGTKEAEALKRNMEEAKGAKIKRKEEMNKQKPGREITSFFNYRKPLDPKAKKDIDDALEVFVVANNDAFELTESPFFRNLLFKAHSG